MAGELEVKETNWIEDTRSYLGDIRSEMKRVTWPNRNSVQSTTVVVIHQRVHFRRLLQDRGSR